MLQVLRKLESADSGIQFRPVSAAAPPEYKEIMTNLMEFKVDVKLEVTILCLHFINNSFKLYNCRINNVVIANYNERSFQYIVIIL